MQTYHSSVLEITGVVPISGASTTHPVSLYGRCGETGERKVVLCWE